MCTVHYLHITHLQQCQGQNIEMTETVQSLSTAALRRIKKKKQQEKERELKKEKVENQQKFNSNSFQSQSFPGKN